MDWRDNGRKQMIEPGRQELISEEHGQLLAGLLDLNQRLQGLTLEERAILKTSIDLVEYLQEYATGPSDEEWAARSQEEKGAFFAERERNRKAPWFTVDEFVDTLICSGGFELRHGHVVPRQ